MILVDVTKKFQRALADIVEKCLEHLTGIKGKAVCVTRADLREEAYSLSWRVQIESKDLQKALESSSWKQGWAVKEYVFYKKKIEEKTDENKLPSGRKNRQDLPLYKQ